MPAEEAVVIDPGNTLVDLGPLSAAERMELEAEVDAGLATTGSGFGEPMSLIGGLLVIVGATLLAAAARRRARVGRL
jgi:hypothetical protein